MEIITPSRWQPEISAGPILAQEPGEPVTLAEAKAHLRYTNTDKDTWIEMLISVARGQVEHMTQRSIIRTSLTLKHASWWEVDTGGRYTRPLVLPKGPVETISLVQYRQSSDGAYVTLASNQYTLDVKTNGRSYLRPAFGVTLPTLYGETWDAIKVDYIAGAASGTPTAVDQRLRMAILLLVAFYFERPESTNWDVPADVASSVRGLTHQLYLEPF